MDFEWDESKSKVNEEKHGISFKDAVEMFSDPFLATGISRFEDETRYINIAKIEGRLWTAVTTKRNGKIRMISVRRSRKGEVKIYEDQ